MLDNEPTGADADAATAPAATGADSTDRSAAGSSGTAPANGDAEPASTSRTRRRATRSAGPPKPLATPPEPVAEPAPVASAPPAEPPADEEPVRKTRTRRRGTKTAEDTVPAAQQAPEPAEKQVAEPADQREPAEEAPSRRRAASPPGPAAVLFVAPEPTAPTPVKRVATESDEPRSRTRARAAEAEEAEPRGRTRTRGAEDEETEPRATRTRSRGRAAAAAEEPAEEPAAESTEQDETDEDGRHRRRRGRRGRGRGKGASDEPETGGESDEESGEPAAADESEEGDGVRRRRRRRRRGSAGESEPSPDEPANVVVKVREPRKVADEVQGVSGSTRLEAKRQRRRDGREQRRTRPPILSESEFLARREAVDRSMVVRQAGDRTQIAVLEDGVLVEHYVAQASGATMVGNVYLGKVQNVLPSMEAAFIDIGRGRNAVLYAGEVNWDSAGLEGRTRAIEKALKPGDAVLVQVTKDPIGHKGARLTSHVTLSGRHLVYVPGGHASGISRKLPDTERKRLRDVLKKLVPEHAGVIVRTAAEGATEDELSRDVSRLQALWETIEKKSKSASAPSLLYEEPDLVIRVVRDLFNEDFKELVVQGSDAWDQVGEYVEHVSPDLVGRLRQHVGNSDVFVDLRVDEQLMKALDRKVFLPSGGSLVIDRTEAMTVIDVNTGKFIGSGGNLEETVTRNNLEAAEEIVRQLRLRDVGGIIVIDFIDMVLESNRELVLRRLTECLGRDRTKHQVTEITSLGLVQMTRKRLGQPLIDAFSETCEHCKGRGIIVHLEPGPAKSKQSDGHKDTHKDTHKADEGKGKRRRKDKDKDRSAEAAEPAEEHPVPVADSVPEPATSDEAESDVAVAADAEEPAPRSRRRSTSRRRKTGTTDEQPVPAETVSADS
ncbi:Rne/Rng family ribonuclease [Actinocatenispora rupis]|nr:Rne/Rng family ribonuclease [Actinocatenispora rupis]